MAEAAATRHRLRGESHTVGIIGWPVSHSLSPPIHNSAFASMGMDWVYVRLPVEPGRLPQALDGLVALGLAGANVTMPHKTESAILADELSEDARLLKAVNTLVVQNGGLHGHNTDAPGFDRFLRRDAGFDPAGRSALVYGSGGAARACALALARGGLQTLTVVARDPGRAQGLLETVDGLGTKVEVVTSPDTAEPAPDLVINATPVGSDTGDLPLPALGPQSLVVDLLYDPAVTALQIAAREAGGTAFGGLGMLLNQAALSFELWTGQQPPLEIMSAAALAELGERA